MARKATQYNDRQWFWRVGVSWLILLTLIVVPSTFAATANQVKGLDFTRSSDESGVLKVELENSRSVVDMRRSGKQLYVELHETQIPDDMLYVLDVKDFATRVDTIETFRTERGVRLVLTMNGAYKYDYSSEGKVLSVTVDNIATEVAAAAQSSEISYNSKPISINFQDVPVRNVLQLIAEYNDFNLVVSDSVKGNLTLRLDDVPWQQVLDIILKSKDLDKREQGSVVMIAPKAELAASEQQVLEAKRKEAELASLSSEIIQINYAKANELGELLQGDEDGVGMLSERGSLHIDERTNALIVNDLPENLESIRDIISALDIPVKQVQIEARIVTVNEGDMDELGVRWGLLSASGDTTVGGSIETNLDSVGMLADESTVDDFLNVNLAAGAGASSIAFQVAKIGDILLDLELSALQTENKAEIISSPRLMTLNKKMAYIEQGTEIPYLESSSSGAVSVGFKKAVLSLMVTPQITPDGKLVLDLVVTQDRKGEVVQTGTGEAVSIETQRIGTQVLVENGETVVLGGIYQNSVHKNVRQVPVLGDLPVLGALFRHKKEELAKRELLIFVTPKIVYQ
ncbi:type IV pilus secretin PilQ [Photobacterium nomapromontoriensis]|uniref:type IV pilus secretin PilQ n=1 Tax=Photobacterium nomapromontoriensis TaxID=2910237 RepID=UPI003D0BD2E4